MGAGTSIGRVRGLGAAHEGTHHWWRQRLTAGSNFLLVAWLLISVARMGAHDFAAMQMWLQSAWVAIPMALLVISVVYHFRLGLQVVIEDYQHDESRVVMMVLLNFYAVAILAAALFAILKIALGAPR
jgi:succinate dehydrogenase / fumarate reductase, membrane anchor subunit